MEKLPRTISYLAPRLNKKNSIIIIILLAVSSLSFLYFWNWNSTLTIEQKNVSTYSNDSLTKPLTDFAITEKHQRLIYNESLDKNSPYFGLIYKNTYGTSSKCEKLEPYDWFAKFTKNLPS